MPDIHSRPSMQTRTQSTQRARSTESSLESMPAGAVILLNGYPGVGKSSVARELVKVIPNARILEYHALRQVVDSLADREREEKRWNQLKKALLQTILQTLSTPDPAYCTPSNTLDYSPGSTTSSLGPTSPPIYILTAHLCATPSRLSLLHAHLSELPLIHILLSCSTEENIRRLDSPARQIPISIAHFNASASANTHNNNNNGRNRDHDYHATLNQNNITDDDLDLGSTSSFVGSTKTNGSVNSYSDWNYISKKVKDEHTLRELRMEEELGRFLGGRAVRGIGNEQSHGQAQKANPIEGLIGEYEVNTERLSVRDTAGIVGEYVLEILRREGWWFHFANNNNHQRKISKG